MTTPHIEQKPNWPLLAAVRWALAVCVMLYHLFLIDVKHPIARFGYECNGFALVLSFFIVSGFSISYSIRARPKGFLMRRVERIYPVYLAAFALAVLPYAYFGGALELPMSIAVAPTNFQFVASALMLQNTVAVPISNFGPSWSLAVECAFYLCAPLLVKLGQRRVIAICAVSALLFAFKSQTRLPGASQYYVDMLYMQPALYLAWAWLIGWLVERNPGNEVVKVAALATPVLFIQNPHDLGQWGTLVMTLTVWALLYGHKLQLSAKLQRLAIYLGDLSYPLYLVHIPTFYILYGFAKITSVGPYICAAFLMSLIIFHLVDQPRRLRAKRVQESAI